MKLLRVRPIFLTFTAIFIGLVFFMFRNDNFIYADKNSSINMSCGSRPIKPEADLVFLSETTHGSESIRSLDFCLIKDMIENHGFTRIILEYDFFDINILNYYINNDKDISLKMIKQILKTSFFDSESFFHMIDWLKNQNLAGRKIKIYGTDNWNGQRLLEGTLEYSEQTNVEICIKKHKNSLKNISLYCSDLLSKVKYRNEAFSTQNYYLLLLKRYLFMKYSSDKLSDQEVLRDRNMFEIFTEILLQSKEKSIVLMHIGHSGYFPEKFGSYLADSTHVYENYLLSFCSGSIASFDTFTKKFIDLEFSASPVETVEASICQNRKMISSRRGKIRYFGANYTNNNTEYIDLMEINGIFVVKKSSSLIPVSLK